MAEKGHTLLLVQFNSALNSRTFLEFDSLSSALDGVCGLYEKEVQQARCAPANSHARLAQTT